MELKQLHHWDHDYRQAVALQRTLTGRVCLQPLVRSPRTVAGVDVSYRRHGEEFYAASVELVLASGCGYRLPEPTRLAHRESNRLRLSSSGTDP